jgi:hypothetical protein
MATHLPASVRHEIYGLRIAANRAIPGLLPLLDENEQIDLRVWLRGTPAFPPGVSDSTDCFYASPCDDSSGHAALRVVRSPGGAYFGFFYSDGARFAVNREGREVLADWPEGYALEDAATYLVGPVMGFVLRLNGIIPLHASAIAIEDQAIALVGMPGAGKSTTAAAFAHHGFAVLSDDVVALQDRGDFFRVAPGYPRVNLWPDSVRALFGSEDALPRITPTWGKHYLPLNQNGCHFQSEQLPLGGIYLLGEREPCLTVPRIEELTAAEALMTLVANTYVNYLLDRDMRHREFDLLSRLVAGVPVRLVRPSADPSGIPAMCETIAGDARNLMISSPAGVASGAD